MDNELSFAIQPDGFYHDLGLKSGLEIHQQLLTEKKLFCRCPAGEYSTVYDAEILRHMRPTLSELGEYDGTALMEFKTRKDIIYQITRETTCTYEMDDAPPFQLNQQALDIGLEIALLLGCNIVGEIHIARKQYLDGSIPTGFQRTTILGVDGEITYGSRKIGIIQLGLEEDSCRQIEDRGHRRTFRTDRLSIPLIESVTRPEMKTPREVADVCEILRRLHRATCKVRTGIGSGREDVNVSIEGGTRVEIKGVHRIVDIPALVHVEAIRQRQLLRLRQALRDRGLRTESWRSRVVDLTDVIRPESPVNLGAALAYGGKVSAVVLPGFGGLLAHPTQPGGVVFAQEIADRLRVVACLDVLPNMVHSDEAHWGGLPESAQQSLLRKSRAEDTDAVVVVWGAERDVQTAVGEIDIRARDALAGVPGETRQALRGGNTAFERILPGPNRMYPDTDLPLTVIEDDRLDAIKAILPDHPWHRESKHRRQGLPEDVIRRLVYAPAAAKFHDRLLEAGHPALLAGTVLTRTMTALRRRGLDVTTIPDAAVEGVFAALAEGRIFREAVSDLLARIAAGEEDPLATFPTPLTEDEIGKRLDAARAEAASREFAIPEARWRWVMGRVMRDVRGRVSGEALGLRARQEV